MAATADSGDGPVSNGMLAVFDDLSRNPDSTVGELAARAGSAPSLVSRILVRLREEGIS